MSNKPCIFVIDDESDLLASIGEILSKDFFVEEFDFALDALEATKNGVHPDVILTDLRMPKMNGFEFLLELNARDITSPVIVATAYSDREIAKKAFYKGAFGLLEKPFDPDYLLALCKKASQYKAANEVARKLLKSYQGITTQIDQHLESLEAFIKTASDEKNPTLAKELLEFKSFHETIARERAEIKKMEMKYSFLDVTGGTKAIDLAKKAS